MMIPRTHVVHASRMTPVIIYMPPTFLISIAIIVYCLWTEEIERDDNGE